MPPAWKVRRGHLVFGSSVRPSVRLSVCPSVRNSVPLINKVQYLKFGWSYSNHTWTVSSSKGCSHFTDITFPWGMGRGQNVGLRDFAIVWLCCRRGHPCFTNTCLVWNLKLFVKKKFSLLYPNLFQPGYIHLIIQGFAYGTTSDLRIYGVQIACLNQKR